MTAGVALLVGASGCGEGAQPIPEGPLARSVAPLVWGPQVQLHASTHAGDAGFGASVALSGDTTLIGAPSESSASYYEGAAYVFVRSGSTWTEQAKLEASDGVPQAGFGDTVCLDGDTALITAPGAYAAYVFVRNGSTWSEQAKLTSSTASADLFGSAAALSGDTALVKGGQTGSGVHVFVRNGTTWSEQQVLTAPVPAGFAYYNEDSVAIDGDTAVVGASIHDVTANGNEGAAYVFVRAGTLWTQEQMLTASDPTLDARLGWSVAIHGDTLVAGATGEKGIQSPTDPGSAYVFVRSGSTWTEQAKLAADDEEKFDRFGYSVALEGDRALVGAARDSTSLTNSNLGSVYVFERTGSTWQQTQKLTASDGMEDDFFGTALAFAGDIAVIGAPGFDVDTDEARGVAYVFARDKLADGDPCTDGSECASGTCIGSICAGTPGTGGSSASGGSSATGGSGASTGGALGNSTSGGDGGCACRVDRTTHPPLGWLALALIAAARRRRGKPERPEMASCLPDRAE